MEQPRCSECHRPLKDPKSIARGVGPVCWAKLQNERGITVPTRTVRIPSKRQGRNPTRKKKLVGVHQRLDLFLNVRESNPPAGEREIEDLLAQDRKKALPIKEGQFSEV